MRRLYFKFYKIKKKKKVWDFRFGLVIIFANNGK